MTRRRDRAALARTIVRRARASLPWRSITLPRSSGRDVQLEHGCVVVTLDLLDADRVGIVHELLGQPGEQLRH